jgi:hypothetical protein
MKRRPPKLKRYAALDARQRRHFRALPLSRGPGEPQEADRLLRWGAFVHASGSVGTTPQRLDHFLYALRCCCDLSAEDGPWWADAAPLARLARDKYCFERLTCGPYLATLADCVEEGGGDALRAVVGCLRAEVRHRRQAPASHLRVLYGRADQNGRTEEDDGYVLRLQKRV